MIAPFLHPFAPPARAREEFLTIVSGEGATVVDAAGRRYIDAMASLWYVNIGYGRAEMADVIADQARRLAGFHTFTSFTNEPAERLAEEIVRIAPFHDGRVFFASSGSEAVESAMKIARIGQRQAGHPERTVIVARGRGYHGVAYGGTSLSGLPPNREGFGPFVGDTVSVDPDDLGKLEAVFDRFPGEIAAVVTEPVQGAGGVWPPRDGYLAGLRALCDEHGAFLVFDEVITGFGRLGSWFAAQRFGVLPDLITFAKAVTSGYVPLSGVVVGPRVRAALERDATFVLRHGFTYSGHPVAAAAGLKNLEILEREGLLASAGRIAARLGGALRRLHEEGRVVDARGDGGMWAVTPPPGVDENAVAAKMLAGGVIARPVSGHLTFCPPLVIDDVQLDRVVDVLTDALGG